MQKCPLCADAMVVREEAIRLAYRIGLIGTRRSRQAFQYPDWMLPRFEHQRL